MSIAQASSANIRLLPAYLDYHRQMLLRALVIAIIIPMIGIPSGIVLDYFVYPEWVGRFFVLRVIVDVLLLAILLLLIFAKHRLNLVAVKALGVISGMILNAAFCLMIYLTNGAFSPYYSAVILIIFAMSILLPWTVVETAILSIFSLVTYAVACIANPSFSSPGATAVFAYNGFFLIITAAVCITITYFLARARFEEFGLRHQLDAQNRKLQDLDRLKTQFFSNVSHELRTPLTLILGPVETLLSRTDSLDAKVHEGLILIHRSSLRLLKLINDLLDLTRLDQGAQVLRRSSMAMGPFVKGMVESVRHLGLSKQLRFKIEDGPADAEMVADPSRIEKVIVNLLTNAIKYTPAGGTITVGWNASSDGYSIEVRDTGVGIPDEDLPKIFDRFHQVRSNLANQTQGVGIGLALAKELVEHHGGTLEVSSTLGVGTSFTVKLPASPDAFPSTDQEVIHFKSPDAVDEPFEKAFRSADRSWRSPTGSDDEELPIMGTGDEVILVADDEEDMRRYVVSLLAPDYRVIQTRSGMHVSSLVQQHKPSLVLLDWMMPGKDGLTTCKELRATAESADLKIMLLTARIDEESKIQALQSGADDFLTKPFSSIEVKTRVENLLRTATLQKDLRHRNTELTNTLKKLQETETILIQSEKMNAIGSLSAGLLHEINNPLNYTLTAISVARQFKESLNSDMQEIFSDIEEGMLRVRDVITDLKDFAYPEKPGTESVFRVEEAFASAKKIMANDIGNIRLDIDLADDLVIIGQKTQITHLFINLLSNAGKSITAHLPTGQGVIRIHGRACEGMAVIEVADNGPGIPEDILNRVFEPFFTTRAVGSGMGMGLSVCHTIMASHHGTIRAGNRREGGAVFSITIPLSQEAKKPC